MTPLLSLCISFSCLLIGVQAPKPPPTALEGTWREPLLPGENAANRLAVTIKGDEITVVWYDGVYRGIIQHGPIRDHVVFAFSIIQIDEKGEKQPRTHNCRGLKQSNELFLQVDPQPVPVPAGRSLERKLAPVTFHLEKVEQ
jgi:hypothetical protein